MGSFRDDLERSKKAVTQEQIKIVLMDVSERLQGASHAIAVDSARQILDALPLMNVKSQKKVDA
jgi:hypothetical protein